MKKPEEIHQQEEATDIEYALWSAWFGAATGSVREERVNRAVAYVTELEEKMKEYESRDALYIKNLKCTADAALRLSEEMSAKDELLDQVRAWMAANGFNPPFMEVLNRDVK